MMKKVNHNSSTLIGGCALFVLASTTSFPHLAPADVLWLTWEGQAHESEIRALIAPVELKRNDRMGLTVEGVVERFASRPGRGSTTLDVRFIDTATGQETEAVQVESSWFMVRNEPDSMRDLAVMFGVPPDGHRIGSRRHARLLVAALSGDQSAQESLKFAGAGLRWAEDRRFSEEDLEAFEASGGKWMEFPDTNDFNMRLDELIAIVAADRRYGHLESGFERAAVTLLRAWAEGALMAASDDTERGRRLAGQAARAVVGPGGRGSVAPYDPPEIRMAMERLYNAVTPAEQQQAETELAAAIARYPDGYPDGRSDMFQAASSVDPSELAKVNIEVMRALQPIALASESRMVRDRLTALPSSLVNYCVEPKLPDPREIDRYDLMPDVEHMVAELFEAANQEQVADLQQLYDGLWSGLMRKSSRNIEQAECEATLMLAAGWDVPSRLEERAGELMKHLAYFAKRVPERNELARRAGGEKAARYLEQADDSRKSLDAALVIAKTMARTPARFGGDAGNAMRKGMRKFSLETEVIREEFRNSRSGDPSVIRGFESELAWRDLLIGLMGVGP